MKVEYQYVSTVDGKRAALYREGVLLKSGTDDEVVDFMEKQVPRPDRHPENVVRMILTVEEEDAAIAYKSPDDLGLQDLPDVPGVG